MTPHPADTAPGLVVMLDAAGQTIHALEQQVADLTAQLAQARAPSGEPSA